MVRDFEGQSPKLGAGAFVDETALVIGSVTLGDDASVWPGTVLRGDIHTIDIGARTNIQDNSVLHVTHDSEYDPGGHAVYVGADVTVGHRVILHGCRVEDRCLIGMGAVIMDGAYLEPEVMVAANSLVSPGKHLEGGYLYMGSPAKQVRPLTDQERAFLTYSAEHYVELAHRHQGG